MDIQLIKPEEKHKTDAEEFIREHFAAGEHVLHGGSLLETMETYEDWLNHLQAQSSPETIKDGWVVASTLFAVRKTEGKIIGIIDIRHYLNTFLARYGGHIGYGVRPSERRKGYGAEILRLGLAYCKTIGLNKVMIACEKDNIASAKTIVKNGGVLEKEFVHSDGNTVQVYWVYQ